MLWARGRQSAEETERKGCDMLDARPRYRPTVSHLSDNPTELSVNSLIARLKSDLATRGLSKRNCWHETVPQKQMSKAGNSLSDSGRRLGLPITGKQAAKVSRNCARRELARRTPGIYIVQIQSR